MDKHTPFADGILAGETSCYYELECSAPPGSASGVILMVVLSLLTLFAIVGLTFVFYADSSATSSDIALRAENQTRPDYDPEAAMSLFLGQIIYDLPDDVTGVYSSFRGHSLCGICMAGSTRPIAMSVA